MNGIDNLEHGWIGSEDRGNYSSSAPKLVGTCAWCGEYIYEDEDMYTYGYNEAGELLCWDCYEESKEHSCCGVA